MLMTKGHTKSVTNMDKNLFRVQQQIIASTRAPYMQARAHSVLAQ